MSIIVQIPNAIFNLFVVDILQCPKKAPYGSITCVVGNHFWPFDFFFFFSRSFVFPRGTRFCVEQRLLVKSGFFKDSKCFLILVPSFNCTCQAPHAPQEGGLASSDEFCAT